MKAVTFYKSESNKRKSINSNTSNPTTGSFNNSNNNSSSTVCCDVENCESTSFLRDVGLQIVVKICVKLIGHKKVVIKYMYRLVYSLNA